MPLHPAIPGSPNGPSFPGMPYKDDGAKGAIVCQMDLIDHHSHNCMRSMHAHTVTQAHTNTVTSSHIHAHSKIMKCLTGCPGGPENPGFPARPCGQHGKFIISTCKHTNLNLFYADTYTNTQTMHTCVYGNTITITENHRNAYKTQAH